MAVITIRNIDESVKSKLRVQAAQPGLGSRMAQRVAGLGAVVLPVPARSAVRPPPDFGDEAPASASRTRSSKPITSKAAPGRMR